MERCPNCRARCDGGPQCRRCGMELAWLLRVERGAEAQLARAVRLLSVGDIAAAVGAIEASRRLQRSALADQLLGFVRMQGNTAG